MWIVMVSMVSGCIMYTVLVANATTMIANVDPAAKEYKSKVLHSPPTLLQEKARLKIYSCDPCFQRIPLSSKLFCVLILFIVLSLTPLILTHNCTILA